MSIRFLMNWAKSFKSGSTLEVLRIDLDVLSVLAKVGVILQVAETGSRGKSAVTLLSFFIGGKNTNASCIRSPSHGCEVVEHKVLGRGTGANKTSGNDGLIGVQLAGVGWVGNVLVSHEEDGLEVDGFSICFSRGFDIVL